MGLRDVLRWSFWIFVIIVFVVVSYIEIFKCGGGPGTYSDVPRWCWLLK